jgi:hypothetical protein
MRFRRNPVAVACDIKEMYLQIEIPMEDRPYFRMLWRDLDPGREPEEYEFSRVVFGKNSAPMEAQFVAQENARKYRDLYSLGKSKYGKQVWVCNSPKVLEVIPEKDRASKITINDGENPTTKTLGLAWNSQKDEFKIPTSEMPRLQITKRNVLKKIATIFGPLGFISPFIVIAKILLQELWSRGYGWDDEIKDEIALRLEQWFHQLPVLNTVTVPRCLRAAEPVHSKEIITFADASKDAYGAVVYIRHEYENGAVTCRLVASKSKVAPLTPTTVRDWS